MRTRSAAVLLMVMAVVVRADTVKKVTLKRSDEVKEVIPAPTKKDSLDVTLRQGLAAIARGDTAEAEQLLKEVVAKDPKQALAYVGLADVALRQGKPAVARTRLETALKLQPANAAILRSWARFQIGQREFSGAEATLKKAAAAGPNEPEPLQELGNLYLTTSRPKEAAETFQRAITLAPLASDLHRGLGTAYTADRNFQQAEAEFKRAVQLNPTDDNKYSLAMLYVETKQVDPALKTLGELLQVSPKFTAALVARGDAYMLRGDDQSAIKDYRSALAIEPKLAAAQFRIGLADLEKKRIPAAEQAFHATLAIDPNYAAALNNLAYLAAERKANLNEALDWALKAVKLQPNNRGYLDTLATVYSARGDNTQAAEVRRKLSASQPVR